MALTTGVELVQARNPRPGFSSERSPGVVDTVRTRANTEAVTLLVIAMAGSLLTACAPSSDGTEAIEVRRSAEARAQSQAAAESRRLAENAAAAAAKADEATAAVTDAFVDGYVQGYRLSSMGGVAYPACQDSVLFVRGIPILGNPEAEAGCLAAADDYGSGVAARYGY